MLHMEIPIFLYTTNNPLTVSSSYRYKSHDSRFIIHSRIHTYIYDRISATNQIYKSHTRARTWKGISWLRKTKMRHDKWRSDCVISGKKRSGRGGPGHLEHFLKEWSGVRPWGALGTGWWKLNRPVESCRVWRV